MPMKPSITSPLWNSCGTNFLVRYFSLKLARSASSLVSPTPPPRLAFSSSRPTVTYHSSLPKPMYWPTLSSALLPDLGNVGLPASAHALDVAVGAAQQQYHGQQRVAAREYAQVLHYDGF